MRITSFVFLIFVALVVGVYFITPKRVRWVVLLAASVFFYLRYDVKLAVWFFITSLTIYAGGLLIDRQEQRYQASLAADAAVDKAQKKLLKKQNAHKKTVIAGIVAAINVAIWIAFKFTDLFILSINRYFHVDHDILGLALPLGISFYTLQAISYVVDLSRGKCPVQKNYFKLTLWLGFFPQMVQGPICRYTDTADQLFTPHEFDYRRIKFGAQLLLWGFFKKFIIAERAAMVSATVFGNSAQYKGLVFLFGALAYTIQIYADFSGGMDIIGGVAEMLGIYMPVNFERPYFSRSIAEYWRRWHITLGAWFREYIFYPLSISKPAQALSKRCRKIFGVQFGKVLPTYLVMALVWTLNGVWHGAGKQFAVYGFYQGLLIVLGMQTEGLSAKIIEKLKINTECFSWKLWQTLRTFALVVWGRILFNASGLREAFRIWVSVFRDRNPWVLTDGTVFTLGLSAWEMFVLFCALLVLLLVDVMHERGYKLREAIERQNLLFRWALYLGAIFAVLLLGYYGKGYNAADFIYANF